MEEGEEEEGIDFDNSEQFAMLPPLDPMRKSRREILFVINEIRMEYINIANNYIEIS